MPNYTNNYNLIKPFQNEHYDVDVANTNNERIDQILKRKLEAVAGKGLSTNDFTDFHKRKLESLTVPYNFRGVVERYEDLPAISTNGYIYGVEETNSTYIWNSDIGDWVDLGPLFDNSFFVLIDQLNSIVMDAISPIMTEDDIILATEEGDYIVAGL